MLILSVYLYNVRCVYKQEWKMMLHFKKYSGGFSLADQNYWSFDATRGDKIHTKAQQKAFKHFRSAGEKNKRLFCSTRRQVYHHSQEPHTDFSGTTLLVY